MNNFKHESTNFAYYTGKRNLCANKNYINYEQILDN